MMEDRLYMRSSSYDARPWMSATALLMMANVAAFLLHSINTVYVHSPLEAYLPLSSSGLAHGYLWQLVTFQFLHAGSSHLFFNLLALYFFGRPVEQAIGKARFFEVYFVSGIFGGLLQAALGWVFPIHFGFPTVGASAGICGLIALFSLLGPDRTILVFFVLPMRAWNFLVISFLVALFYVIVPSEPGVAHAAHLGGLIGGAAYMRWIVRSERRLFNWRPYQQTVEKRELVHSAAPKRPGWKRAAKAAAEDLPPGEFISREVDPILDKISAQGIHSLTERERTILEAARRKMARRE